MTLHPTWLDLAVRLAATLGAGSLLGLDRSRHEHPAGLRTSLLVSFAASIAMILANVLLATSGKDASSFATLDFMRLPLGVLTGVGFIGAGAIIKRDEAVIGVTTAATMWLATMIGLCMGSGQLVLGGIATVAACAILWALKPVERLLYRSQRATLMLKTTRGTLPEEDLRAVLATAQIDIKSLGTHITSEPQATQCFDAALRWQPDRSKGRTPPELVSLAQRAGVLEMAWKPSGAPSEE